MLRAGANKANKVVNRKTVLIIMILSTEPNIVSTGYHGKQCENETNECLSDPCQNGGSCIDLVSHRYFYEHGPPFLPSSFQRTFKTFVCSMPIELRTQSKTFSEKAGF